MPCLIAYFIQLLVTFRAGENVASVHVAAAVLHGCQTKIGQTLLHVVISRGWNNDGHHVRLRFNSARAAVDRVIAAIGGCRG